MWVYIILALHGCHYSWLHSLCPISAMLIVQVLDNETKRKLPCGEKILNMHRNPFMKSCVLSEKNRGTINFVSTEGNDLK